MAIKTFTTGEVLTASDTNTYLANSGLVYVGGGSLSSNITNFANCFTSTYDNYRVVVGNLDNSSTTTTSLSLRLSNAGTTVDSGYEWWTMYWYASGTGSEGNASATAWQLNYYSDGSPAGAVAFDICSPKKTEYTTGMGSSMAYQSGAGGYVFRQTGGVLKNSTAYDGFSLLVGNGTMSGTVSIYGYRKGN